MKFEIQCSLIVLLAFCAVNLVLIGCEKTTEGLTKIDPGSSSNWTSRKVTESSGATSYIFEGDVRPPLNLKTTYKTATIASTEDVNAVLGYLGLPTVAEPQPDKGNLENNPYYRGQYHWPEYPLGPLVVYRSVSKDKRTSEFYDDIWKVRIDKVKN